MSTIIKENLAKVQYLGSNSFLCPLLFGNHDLRPNCTGGSEEVFDGVLGRSVSRFPRAFARNSHYQKEAGIGKNWTPTAIAVEIYSCLSGLQKDQDTTNVLSGSVGHIVQVGLHFGWSVVCEVISHCVLISNVLFHCLQLCSHLG